MIRSLRSPKLNVNQLAMLEWMAKRDLSANWQQIKLISEDWQ